MSKFKVKTAVQKSSDRNSSAVVRDIFTKFGSMADKAKRGWLVLLSVVPVCVFVCLSVLNP